MAINLQQGRGLSSAIFAHLSEPVHCCQLSPAGLCLNRNEMTHGGVSQAPEEESISRHRHWCVHDVLQRWATRVSEVCTLVGATRGLSLHGVRARV